MSVVSVRVNLLGYNCLYFAIIIEEPKITKEINELQAKASSLGLRRSLGFLNYISRTIFYETAVHFQHIRRIR
jgi:hypothetical protein